MGVKVYTFVGPFLECKAIKKEKEISIGLRCPAIACLREVIHGSFCPYCGTRGEEVIRKELEVDEDIWDLPELIDERLSHLQDHDIDNPENAETHVWISNHVAGPGRSYGDGEQGSRFIEETDITADKQGFQEKYAEEMKTLERFYDSCQLRWGVVTYWC